MDSQDAVENALDKLSTVSNGNINDVLPDLISSLKISSEHPAQFMKVVCALFQQCVPKLESLDAVESYVFDPALPVVHCFLTEILQGVKTTLEQEENDSDLHDALRSLLQVAVSLLENLECSLDFMTTIKDIHSNRVQKFLKHFGAIIIDTLQHCSDSQNLYGSHFNLMFASLEVFFQTNNKILLKFIGVVGDNICYDCTLSDQVDILCNVLTNLSKAGKLSTCLGNRAMLEVWKLYATLTTKHAAELQDYLRLEAPIFDLASEITRILEDVAQKGGEEKSEERKLKIASFLLRVVIKLCEQFTGIVDDHSLVLIQLVVSLYRHSELGCELHGSKSSSQLIDRILIVGTEPLLAHLLNSHKFSKEVLADKKECDPCSYFLLLIAVSRQLVHASPESRSLWLSTAEITTHLFYKLSSTLQQCQETICSHLTTENSSGEIYEMILTACTSVMAVLSREELLALEEVLFRVILSHQIGGWQALFICDAWVLLARVAGPAVCQAHIEHLMSVLQRLAPGAHRTLLVSLVRRLLFLMPAKFKSQVPADISELHPKPLENATSVVRLMQTFINTPPTVSSFEDLLRSLHALSNNSPQSLRPIMPSLPGLWNFVEDSRLGRMLGSKLLNVTSLVAPQLNNKQLSAIIAHLPSINNQSLKLQCISLLSDLSSQVFAPDEYQDKVFEQIASAYSCLLEDSDQLVVMLTLQSFDQFAHKTKHEIIITKTVNVSQDIKNLVANYLKSKPEASNAQEFLQCYKQIVGASFALETGSTSKVQDRNKASEGMTDIVEMTSGEHTSRQDIVKVTSGEQATDLITRLSSAADSLLAMHKKSGLSQGEMTKVEGIVATLNEICNPFFS